MGLVASGVDGFGLFVCGVLIPGWGGWYAVFHFPEVLYFLWGWYNIAL